MLTHQAGLQEVGEEAVVPEAPGVTFRLQEQVLGVQPLQDGFNIGTRHQRLADRCVDDAQHAGAEKELAILVNLLSKYVFRQELGDLPVRAGEVRDEIFDTDARSLEGHRRQPECCDPAFGFQVKPAQDVAPRPAPIVRPPAEPIVATSSTPVTAAAPKPAKRGFLDRVNPLNVFRSEPKLPPRPTPLPPVKEAPAPAQQQPVTAASLPAATGPPSRYNYRSPAKPNPGNREEAERFFAQGLQAHQAHRLNDAMQSYRQAILQDPSFFEAQFYLAFAATEAGSLPTALTGYEYALAINPNDANARYNFALVLKQANCVPDAVTELERLLAVHPNEARAHLALANIYAQQLRQPADARPHYLKALELDPRSPQASDIRNWLKDHPQ